MEKRRVKPGVFEVAGNYICFYNTDEDIKCLAWGLSENKEVESITKGKHPVNAERDLYLFLLELRNQARDEYLEDAERLAEEEQEICH